MVELLLDTNILIYSFDKKYDINRLSDDVVYGPYSLNTLSLCIEELKSLGRNDVAAWASSVNIKILKAVSVGNVDDSLLKTALDNKMLLVTADKELIHKANAIGVGIGKIENGKIRVISLHEN